ncbi:MAG: DUF6427 family protein [Bacteroidales bacterium]|nr:DUF6427 family protein [Bacteroidales bacterium]
MLIRYFTSNMPFQQLLGIIFTAILLWLGFLFGVETWSYREHAEPLAFILENVMQNQPYWAGVIALLSVLFQSLWINYLVHRIGFLSKTSYLAAFLYLLFTASLEGNLMPGTAVIGNFFALAVLNAMINAYYHKNTLRSVFHASLFAGIGSLFYFPVLGLWIFVIVVLIIYRQLTFREIFFSLLGLLPVLAGLFTFYFWKGDANAHFQILGQAFTTWKFMFKSTLPELLVGVMILIFILISVVYALIHQNERVIRVQRFIAMLNWYIILVILLSGYSFNLFQHIILLIPVAAIFLSSMLEGLRKKTIAESLIWIFIILVTVYRLESHLEAWFQIDFPTISLF